jgi:hypothetical protein
MAREIQERAGSEARVLNSAKLPFIWDAPGRRTVPLRQREWRGFDDKILPVYRLN